MTLQEAQNLIEQVQREEPRIVATLDDENAKTDNRRYRVKVELTMRNRVMLIYQADEWESVKQAWSHWLPGLYQEPEYCLIDGMVMHVAQDNRGYWYSDYRQEGVRTRRYFGKQDPREIYPMVEKREEQTA